MLKASILSALMAFPQCFADRGDDRKPAQLETIAEAIAVVVNRSHWRDELLLAALLLTIAYSETRLCIAEHAGKPGLNGAESLYQFERGSRIRGYHVGLDLESTISVTQAAADHLGHSWQCGGSPRGFFLAYTSAPCDASFKGLDSRVRIYWLTRSRLMRAQKEAA